MSKGPERDDDGEAQTGTQNEREATAVVTWRSFTFDDHDDEKAEEGTIRLQIREEMCADYGLYVWPSSIFLAAYLHTIREHIAGKNVLEIGAGTGLPGILCAKLGATSVSLTDTGANSKVLENLRTVSRENKVDDVCKVQELCWGTRMHIIFICTSGRGLRTRGTSIRLLLLPSSIERHTMQGNSAWIH